LLSVRDNAEHQAAMREHVRRANRHGRVNLYPFEETSSVADVTWNKQSNKSISAAAMLKISSKETRQRCGGQ